MAFYDWTPERVNTLRVCWADGLSASDIARVLGGGLTRSAVIGKKHRLALAPRQTQPRPVRTRQPRAKSTKHLSPAQRQAFGKPKARYAPAEAPATPNTLPPIDPSLGVLGLNAMTCRYPIGHPNEPDFAFCGRTCEETAAYCCDHARLCYQPSKPAPRQHDVRPDWREGVAA